MLKGIWHGVAAGIGMFLFYFILLFFANNFQHAVQQTLENLPFIIALVIGFGVQVALFFHVRLFSRELAKGRKVMGSAGISLGSMAACCAHHLTDLGIVLGASGLIALLAKFQTALFVLAIASNVYGIAMMLTVIKNFKLYSKGGKLEAICRQLPDNSKNVALAAAIIIVPAFFLAPLVMSVASIAAQAGANELSAQAINVGDVEINSQPQVKGQNLAIAITLTTHSGNPSIDFTRDAFALDSTGRKYYGNWSGSTPAQGHHMSGTLTFTNFAGKLAELHVNNVKGREAILRWG